MTSVRILTSQAPQTHYVSSSNVWLHYTTLLDVHCVLQVLTVSLGWLWSLSLGAISHLPFQLNRESSFIIQYSTSPYFDWRKNLMTPLVLWLASTHFNSTIILFYACHYLVACSFIFKIRQGTVYALSHFF